MKNVLSNTKKVILIVATMATVMGYANEISLTRYGKDLKSTALTIENVKEGNLLFIKDVYGSVLYKEVIEQTGLYTKGFDLTALPDGNYSFELEKDMEIKTMPFTVDFKEVTVNENQETTVYKPHVDQKDGLIYITKLAPAKEPLAVKVFGLYDNDSELLFSETITDTQSIERIYKLEAGRYKIVFSTNNKEFTKFINK
ncbi:hypothetical protein [Seonamhaeicola sp. ML3]|uniref:hypothetical protein n=1 Tax=Seonamhaeicola sp. ML3 TaxID=2937786 RepID=UPI0020109BE8|nr:hypothetical protein [Seonamhaeicola sp. ML3]